MIIFIITWHRCYMLSHFFELQYVRRIHPVHGLKNQSVFNIQMESSACGHCTPLSQSAHVCLIIVLLLCLPVSVLTLQDLSARFGPQ